MNNVNRKYYERGFLLRCFRFFSLRDRGLGMCGKVINDGFLVLIFIKCFRIFNFRGGVWVGGGEGYLKVIVLGCVF